MELNYQIVRSPKRKKLTITVERDRSIVVHAPEGTAEETIRRVVETKRQWLFDKTNHAQKYQDRPHAPGKEVVNGDPPPISAGNTASKSPRPRAAWWSSHVGF